MNQQRPAILKVRDVPACQGCSMYQTGAQPFVPDEIVDGSEVFVLGQNPGVDECREGRPFVGKTGQVMMQRYFPEAGLERGGNVSLGNVLRCRGRASVAGDGAEWQGDGVEGVSWCVKNGRHSG